MASLGIFSLARQFTGGNRPQMFDVLAKQDSEFGQHQPCVIVICRGCERTQMPNFVFQSTGGHEVLTEEVAV